MIAGLIGKIYKKEITHILINVNGVIYEVFVSLNTLPRIKDDDILLITQIIREDSMSLFGFLEKDEKEVFDNLIKISGIGPKVAMSICSTFNPQDVINIIHNNDFTNLKKVPGIGEKMAKRIIVEMSGKIDNIQSINIPNSKREAILALESLGFKFTEISKFIEQSNHQTTQEIIKEVLQKIKK